MIDIYKCNNPTKPTTTFVGTSNFGIPKGRKGRNGQTIQGIVIHCVENANEYFTNSTHRNWITGDTSTPDIISAHYVVGRNNVSQFVCDEDIALGFQPLLKDCPVKCEIEWSLKDVNPNSEPDSYLLHIVVDKPTRATRESLLISNQNCPCPSSSGLDKKSHSLLVRLLAFLTFEYGIPVTSDFITFVDDVVVCELEDCESPIKECPCGSINDLLCEINDYCEGCQNPADSTFASGDLTTLYGQNGENCKTKQSIEDLFLSRIVYLNGVLGFVNNEGEFVPFNEYIA